MNWISVKDRLPEKEGLYHVKGRAKVWEAFFVYIGPSKGWLNNAINPPIEYWEEMSEPPKED